MSISHSDANLIRAGATALANWRLSNPNARIKCKNERFTNLDLSSGDFSNFDLQNCVFDYCNLKHANFSNSDLSGSAFNHCCLDNANFSHSTVYYAKFANASISAALFINTKGLSRLRILHIPTAPTKPPRYDAQHLPLIDRWFSWEKLRFLAKIRIFVPAYTSLVLSVVFLNITSGYNTIIQKINEIAPDKSFVIISPITPSWIHLLVIANFLFIAVSATLFIACPSRITEFSREKWLVEAQNLELLYDHAAWQLPIIRFLCAISLGIGGILGAFLLIYGITKQIIFIAGHASQ